MAAAAQVKTANVFLAQVRTALRDMKLRGVIVNYYISNKDEIVVRDHVKNGTVLQGWTLYAHINAPELPLMLGIE